MIELQDSQRKKSKGGTLEKGHMYIAGLYEVLGMSKDDFLKDAEAKRKAQRNKKDTGQDWVALPQKRTLADLLDKRTGSEFRGDTGERFLNLIKLYCPNIGLSYPFPAIDEFKQLIGSQCSDQVDYTAGLYREGGLSMVSKQEQLNALAPYTGFYHLARMHRMGGGIVFELIQISAKFDSGVVCKLLTRKGNLHHGCATISGSNIFFNFVRPGATKEPRLRTLFVNAPGERKPTFLEGCLLRTANTDNIVVTVKCAIKKISDNWITESFVDGFQGKQYNADDLTHHEKDNLPVFGVIPKTHYFFKAFVDRLSQYLNCADSAGNAENYWRDKADNWPDPKLPVTASAG